MTLLAQEVSSPINVAFLDLSKAFHTVSHTLIRRVLEDRGVDLHVRGLLLSLYDGAATRFEVGDSSSQEIHILRGVKQGCTVSPFLFNLCLDPLIRTIGQMAGFRWGQKDEDQVSILTYADDIALVSCEKTTLEAMINMCKAYFDDVGLRFNTKKCATFGINRPSNARVLLNHVR